MTPLRLGLGAILLLAGVPVWAATLTVGQSTVVGGNVSVVVPVTLTSGFGEEVAAAQFSLSYNPDSLTLNGVAAGASAAAAGKDVSFSFPEEGTALVIVSGFNQTVMTSGVLANLSLTTSPSISIGAHPLVCSEVVLSDALGNAISSTGVSGAVNTGGLTPNVVGLAQAAAQTALTSVGLLVGTVTPAHSDNVAAGLVVSQSPAAATDVAYGTTVHLTVSLGPPMVTVPSVVGLTQNQAQTALAATGLSLGSVSTENSDTVAAGLVIRQAPTAGSAASSGSAVSVVLSLGPQTVTVPSVVGMTQVQAQTALVAGGLNLGAVTAQFNDTVTAGLIFQQTPAPGDTVASGSSVSVVISKGPATVTVPNLAGMTQTEAESALATANLVMGTLTVEFSDIVAAGLVLRQTPGPGSSTASGATVAVVISKGPQTAVVPNVAGMTQAAAQETLAAAGLLPGDMTREYSDIVAAGLVIDQTPGPGTAVALGSTVAVVLSRGPQNVPVPDVVGMSQVAAQYRIIAAGLALGTVTTQQSATIAAGLVIEQDPAAGLAKPPGTAVNLTVSGGSLTTSVPAVAGLSQEAAQDAITAAGLALGEVSHEYSDNVEAGLVIRQSPDAAATANAGDPVDIVVSDGPPPGGCNGCADITGKALDPGLADGKQSPLSAVFTLLSIFRGP